MAHPRLQREIIDFLRPLVTLADGQDEWPGAYAVIQEGPSQRRARKRMSPVPLEAADGNPRDPGDAAAEILRQLAALETEDHDRLYLAGFFRGQTHPDSYLLLSDRTGAREIREPDPNAPPGASLAAANATLTLETLQMVRDLHAELAESRRDQAEMFGRLVGTELMLTAATQADPAERIRATMEVVGPYIGPALAQVASAWAQRDQAADDGGQVDTRSPVRRAIDAAQAAAAYVAAGGDVDARELAELIALCRSFLASVDGPNPPEDA